MFVCESLIILVAWCSRLHLKLAQPRNDWINRYVMKCHHPQIGQPSFQFAKNRPFKLELSRIRVIAPIKELVAVFMDSSFHRIIIISTR